MHVGGRSSFLERLANGGDRQAEPARSTAKFTKPAATRSSLTGPTPASTRARVVRQQLPGERAALYDCATGNRTGSLHVFVISCYLGTISLHSSLILNLIPV